MHYSFKGVVLQDVENEPDQQGETLKEEPELPIAYDGKCEGAEKDDCGDEKKETCNETSGDELNKSAQEAKEENKSSGSRPASARSRPPSAKRELLADKMIGSKFPCLRVLCEHEGVSFYMTFFFHHTLLWSIAK